MTRLPATYLRIVAIVAAFACGPAALREVPRPGDPPIARIAFDSSAAFAILDASLAPKDPIPDALLESAPILADAARRDPEQFLRALGDEAAPDSFGFLALRDPATNANRRRLLFTAIEAIAVRRGVIESVVSRYLPTDSPATTLRVFLCFGFPGRPSAIPILTADGRGLVLDLCAVATRCEVATTDASFRDRFGEELTRVVAPELFIAAYESLESALDRALPRDDLERFRRTLLVLGIADHLARRPEERFDDQGRRHPEFDVASRVALARFERNLTRALDPKAPAAERDALRFSFSEDDHTQDARWGVIAGSAMIDAIDRFAPHGRIRAVVATGPASLARAYAEVCSGHAAIPRLSIETISRLAR